MRSLLSLSLVVLAVLAAAVPAHAAGERRFPVLVSLHAPATAERVAALERNVGDLTRVHRFSAVDAFAARATAAQIEALRHQGAVVAQDEQVVPFIDESSQAGFGVAQARIDAPGIEGDRDGDPDRFSPSDLVTAVIDSGIDTSEPGLGGGKVIGFRDFVGNSTEPYDDLGHGTWVSGVVAGDGPDNLSGVAPGSALVGVKVVDADANSSLSLIAQGIEWVIANRARYGIEAINLSIGDPTGCGDGEDVASQMVDAAVANGLVVVAAAGNDGPATCSIKAPAAAAGALTVGAMADPGAGGFRMSALSSRGPTQDGRLKPDVVAGGVEITSIWPGMPGGLTGTGSSGAAPLVTGTALLVLDADPSLTPAEVKATIAGSAEDWGSPGPDVDYGAGRMDAYAALHAAGAPIATPPAVPARTTFSATVAAGQTRSHAVTVTRLGFPVAATLIGPGGLDLELRSPQGTVVASSATGTRQEDLAVIPTATGPYTFEVTGTGSYVLDVSAGSGAPAGAPALALDPPATPTRDSTPAISGRAGTEVGDFPGVAVRLWSRGEQVRALSAVPLADGRWSVAVNPPLPDGNYEVLAEQGDAAGNFARKSTTLTVDTTPPDTSITSGTAGRFSFAATEPSATFECALDGAAWRACATPWTGRGLAPGGHRFAVRATDRAGNADRTPATRTWTVTAPPPPPPDTTPPTLQLTPTRATLAALTGRGLALGATCSEACTIHVTARVSAATARRLGLGRRAAAAAQGTGPARRDDRGWGGAAAAARRPVTIARATASLAGAGAAEVVVRPTKRARKRLRRARRLTLSLTAVAADRAGNDSQVARRLVLRRR
jgi:serine protease AprX